MALSFCVVGSAASNRRARGVTGIERIDERQHIADRAPAFGRSAPRLLLVPALCALSGRFLLLRRLFRKGSAGRLRVMHPVCIVARYVGEILQQAIETDVLVVIAANCGRCVRSTKFCVFVVQHGCPARADSHAPLTDRADDRKIPVIQMKGHTVFPAIVEDSHLLFSILTKDGIAASAEPVSGIKRLRQGLERTDRLWVKTADEKTRLRIGRKRRSGTGCISEISDHLFEGRYSPKWPDGKKHARNVYAHTREECEEKLKVLIAEMKAEIVEAQRLKDLGEGDGRPLERKKRKCGKKEK